MSNGDCGLARKCPECEMGHGLIDKLEPSSPFRGRSIGIDNYLH